MPKYQLRPGIKPQSEKDMSPHVRLALLAFRRSTRKMRKELRMRGMPIISWKNGKVIELPA